jgi:hypothetical protein
MKTLFLFSLILLSLTSYAQHLAPERGDNLVIIATRDSLPVAFKKLQRLLIDNGYTITSKDGEFYTLATDELHINKTDVNMSISASIKEMGGGLNYIILQGKYSMPSIRLSGNAGHTGLYTGADKLCYRTLTDVAVKYGGETMYDKR